GVRLAIARPQGIERTGVFCASGLPSMPPPADRGTGAPSALLDHGTSETAQCQPADRAGRRSLRRTTVPCGTTRSPRETPVLAGRGPDAPSPGALWLSTGRAISRLGPAGPQAGLHLLEYSFSFPNGSNTGYNRCGRARWRTWLPHETPRSAHRLLKTPPALYLQPRHGLQAGAPRGYTTDPCDAGQAG